MRLRAFVFSVGVIGFTACGGADSPATTPPAASEVAPPAVGIYVTNETSGDLTIIDAGTELAIATIPLAQASSRGIAASPDKKFLYVALSGSPVAGPGVDESKLPPPDCSADGIGVVDVLQRKLVKVLQSGTDPEQVAVSRDGQRLFVANEDAAQLSVIDVATARVLETFRFVKNPRASRSIRSTTTSTSPLKPTGRCSWSTPRLAK